jgi:hypothetical protein
MYGLKGIAASHSLLNDTKMSGKIDITVEMRVERATNLVETFIVPLEIKTSKKAMPTVEHRYLTILLYNIMDSYII